MPDRLPVDLRGRVQSYLSQTAGEPPAVRQAGVAALMLEHALRVGDDQLADEAADSLAAAAGDVPTDHPDRAEVLSNLSAALGSRFHRYEQESDLAAAISAGREALAATPAGDPDRTTTLSNLGLNLQRRGERTGAASDLIEAVDLARQALAATPASSGDRPARLLNLSLALKHRYGQLGSRGDLAEAIDLGRQALAAVPPGAADHQPLSHLASALTDRFRLTDAVADLDEAIALGRRAVAAAPATSIDRAGLRSNLATMVWLRFERTGVDRDLAEAIDLGRQAIATTSVGSPRRPGMLRHLGLALRMRFERTGADHDLAEAIDVTRQAIAAAPRDSRDRLAALSNLALALRERFGHTGAAADLDQAVAVGRQVLDRTPPGDPERAGDLSNLGVALRMRSERTGDAADLDQAIALGREAVALTPPDDPGRAGRLTNLSASLHRRFERAAASEDLLEALEASRQAVAAAAAGDPRQATYLSNLGLTLSSRFDRFGDPRDLDEAIEVQRRAVAAVPTGRVDRAAKLTNLGLALRTRFNRAGDLRDLDEAVVVHRQAVVAASADHADRTAIMANYGWSLATRYEWVHLDRDLLAAIEVHRHAADATPPDDPDRAGMLANLGLLLVLRHETGRAAADLDEALDAWSRATALRAAPVGIRLTAAERRARLVAQRRGPAAAVTAYEEALALVPLLAWRGLARADQQVLLERHAASLGREAAACAVAAGEPERAVELLELGRGVLWSQLLETRGELADLERVAPELATALRECRAMLDDSAAGPGEPHHDPLARRRAAEARMRAGRRFDDLVAQVRGLRPDPAFPHPERFLKPPAVGEVLPSGAAGPVVVVNVSGWRCDALVVRHDGVEVVPLPELTEAAVVDRAGRYLSAWQEFGDGRRAAADVVKLEMAIGAILEWLWDSVAAPVLAALGYREPAAPPWPRLWWCPTGLLAVLPLHAAGRHGAGAVHDLVVSSYTPTLRALHHARTRPRSSRPPRLLAIAVPDTPGRSPLPGAATERDLVCARFPPGRRTALTGAAASRDGILAALAGHSWLHAACHGSQDLAAPMSGGLLPHDWQVAGLVTVGDLTAAAQPGGEFAFLSACHTATGGVTNPDEVISIAAAMQFAGWRHINAGIWSTWDDAASRVAREVYDTLATQTDPDAAGAAVALHLATRSLRGRHPLLPSAWAPFIHIGP